MKTQQIQGFSWPWFGDSDHGPEFFLFVKSLSLIRAISGPLQDVIWGSTSKPREWKHEHAALNPLPSTILHRLLSFSSHTSQLCGRSVLVHWERNKSQFSVAYTQMSSVFLCKLKNGKQLCFILTEEQPCKTLVKDYFPKRVKLWRYAWSPTLLTNG